MSFAVPPDIRSASPKVFRLEMNGQTVFVKQRRPSKNPLGKRLQRLLFAASGNPLLAPTGVSDNNVRTEAGNLKHMAALGLPVPAVLHEEDDYFVMTRTGRKLERYLIREPERREEYIRRAAELLRKLHSFGLAHGGAQIRNFTKPEDNDLISLIDFEEVISVEHMAEFQLRDLFLLVFSLEKKNMVPDISLVCRYYAGGAADTDADGWRDVHRRLCRAVAALRPVAALDTLVPSAIRMADIRSLARLTAKAKAEQTR